MADNIDKNATGVVPVASDDIGGIAFQRIKIVTGTDGVNGGDISPTNPLPVIDSDATATGTITTTDAVVAAPAGAGATVSGSSTAGSLVALACPGGDSAWNVMIKNLTSGTLYFEVSLNSTNGTDGDWINVNGRQTGIVNTILSGNTTTNGVYRGNTSGVNYFRIRSVGALSGTPVITIRHSAGVGAVFLNASIPAGSNNIGFVTDKTAATLGVTVTGAAAAIATLTLPAAGAGLFHYITSIDITLYNAAARTGSATPVLVTTTNLPGAHVWNFPSAGAIGTVDRFSLTPTDPTRSSVANTATTIVGPATAGILWRINATYYTTT